MTNWALRPWRRAFDFRGRATRREYWLFYVQLAVAWVTLSLLMAQLIGTFESVVVNVILSLALVGFMLFACIAILSASIRRLHDHDKTGWLFLLTLIPLVGWIFFLIMMLTPGTRGENDYGYDPRDGERPELEEIASIFA